MIFVKPIRAPDLLAEGSLTASPAGRQREQRCQERDTSRSATTRSRNEERRVDDEYPEHRALQDRPIRHSYAPAAHQDRKVVGELAEVTRGKEQEQRELRVVRLKEERPERQEIQGQEADGQIDPAQKCHAGRQGGGDGISTLLPGYKYLQRIALRNAELDECAAEPERVEEQDEIRKSHVCFP
ncbi:hypothetical protein ACF1BQ_037055 [Bradyrhizobium sp. RDT10]